MMKSLLALPLLLLAPAAHAAAVAAASSGASAAFGKFATTAAKLQDSMIAQAKAADPEIQWTVDEHSRGRAVIIEDGSIWEKGCISYTLIENGELTAQRAAAISARTSSSIAEGARYSACALSFVLHARSPCVPTLRGDVRIFAVSGGAEWYGGGYARSHRSCPQL